MSLEIGTDEDPQHFHDDMGDHVGTRLNWLRAAVLGRQRRHRLDGRRRDGCGWRDRDSGVDPDRRHRRPHLGALSMGTRRIRLGHTQRDSEKSILGLEARELEAMPETEERELATMYEEKGLSPETAEPGGAGAH